MSNIWYILVDGIPVKSTLESYSAMKEKDRRIRITQINKEIRVSTVFLGINHNHGEGDPILFETMVFGGEYDEYMRRYVHYKEALLGHRLIVKALKKKYGSL